MIRLIIFITALEIYSGCNNRQHATQDLTTQRDSVSEKMIAVNKLINERENQRIEDFIVAHNMHPQKTGTGLRYEITKSGSGKIPVATDTVRITYKLTTLDGRFIEEINQAKPAAFVLGRGATNNGLEEAIAHIPRGSEAKIIVPKYLAYGMFGDREKVEGNAALYYELKVLE